MTINLKNNFVRNYGFAIVLMVSIIIGAGLGALMKDRAASLKPLGDIFLNVLFTVVTPLVFFSISSTIAGMRDVRRFGKIVGWMMVVFIATGILSSCLMIIAVKFFPPNAGHEIVLAREPSSGTYDLGQGIVRAVTVGDFTEIFSRKNMLALIVFAVLVGCAALMAGERGRPFAAFLSSGNAVMGQAIRLIMFYAPVGLGAYFAYLVGVWGPQLMGSYLRVAALYYPVAIGYFFVFFSMYTFWAGGREAVQNFWRNIIPPAITAWGTGSSVATIPSNLEAARKNGVPQDIREVVIPIGATIHMDGSCLAAIVKISLLFGLYGMDFAGPGVILTAIGISLLAGTVMSGIPGGGFIGEMFIVTMYGFPVEALPIISMVGTIVDPPATMVNASGDNAASMMVARILGGKNWVQNASF